MASIDFARFQAEILSLYEPPMRAKATHRQMRQVLHEFAELPEFRRTSDIRADAIAAWIKRHADRSPARTASMLRCLSAACNYAVKAGYLKVSPLSFRSPSEWLRSDCRVSPKPRPQLHRSATEILRVLDQADTEARFGSWEAARLQALVYTYAFTGLRKGEALNLQITDLDLPRQIMTIGAKPHWRPKTVRSAARLPIPDPLAAVLTAWTPRCDCPWVFPGAKRRGPWTGGCPGSKPLDVIRDLGRRAEVPNLTIASFRKTIGTLAKVWGFSQLELKSLLRHTNVETQRWYDEEDVDVLRQTVAKIQYRCTASV